MRAYTVNKVYDSEFDHFAQAIVAKILQVNLHILDTDNNSLVTRYAFDHGLAEL